MQGAIEFYFTGVNNAANCFLKATFTTIDDTIAYILNLDSTIKMFNIFGNSTSYKLRYTPLSTKLADHKVINSYLYQYSTTLQFTKLLVVLLFVFLFDKYKLLTLYAQPTAGEALEDLSINNGFFYLYLFYVLIMSFITVLVYFLGVKGVYITSIIGILVFWLAQLFIFNFIILHGGVLSFNSLLEIPVYGGINFNISFLVNYITFSFLFLTTTIGIFAVVYSLVYFKNEPHADRFVILLNWFIISMSLLVISDNALLLYLG